ncbi:MAG: PIG-L deacetylase family protein [Bacteroidales bacterium]
MNTARRILYLVIIFVLGLWLNACGPGDSQTVFSQKTGSVCAILAHPDDETIISGTLALFADRGFEISMVYVTSGDDGPDETGHGLHGKALAEVREAETHDALKIIGIEKPPVFMRFPDGQVAEYEDSVSQTLITFLDEIKPQIVIGFGPDGITGSWDHKAAGAVTDLAFDQSVYGILLLHMAVTKPLPPFYANGVAVPRNMVDLHVKVSKFMSQKKRVVEAHKTQFNGKTCAAYKFFAPMMRFEKFIIAEKRDGDEIFEIKVP